MVHLINKLAVRVVQSFGYTLTLSDPIMEKDAIFQKIYQKCQPFTMTTKPAMYELYKAVEYIVKSKIEGDLIECGVWKGGSSMLMALTLIELNDANRKIYLYDTFEGMSEPTGEDYRIADNDASADVVMKKSKIFKCISPLDEVRANVLSTNYPKEKIHFVKGKVEDTIPGVIPSGIALLRLDTDWYESTFHELVHLYPLLQRKGVLILDDYGYWAGHKKAVDEYFADKPIHLVGISSGVRIGIKTD